MDINDIEFNTEIQLINRFISMSKLYEFLNIPYTLGSNMFCPFHENVNTPSAHLYSDSTGERMWCFAEGKMYGAWNIYKTFLPQVSTKKLAFDLLSQFSEVEQKALLENLGNELELEHLPYKDKLDDFKYHRISYSKLLEEIALFF